LGGDLVTEDNRIPELRAAMVEADRNYQPPPAPEPGADRWVHLRNTCPHGIVRGLITCPQCEPDKQAAAEASARTATVRASEERAIPEPTEGTTDA
jgi:hypothetical protein